MIRKNGVKAWPYRQLRALDRHTSMLARFLYDDEPAPPDGADAARAVGPIKGSDDDKTTSISTAAAAEAGSCGGAASGARPKDAVLEEALGHICAAKARRGVRARLP